MWNFFSGRKNPGAPAGRRTGAEHQYNLRTGRPDSPARQAPSRGGFGIKSLGFLGFGYKSTANSRQAAYEKWQKKLYAKTEDKGGERAARDYSPLDKFSPQQATPGGPRFVKGADGKVVPETGSGLNSEGKAAIEKQLQKRVKSVDKAYDKDKISHSQAHVLRKTAGLTEDQAISRQNMLSAIKSQGQDLTKRSVTESTHKDPSTGAEKRKVEIKAERTGGQTRDITIHGTWSHGSGANASADSKANKTIRGGQSEDTTVIAHWSGGVRQSERDRGGEQVAGLLKDVKRLTSADTEINVLGHSHGGNVGARAIALADVKVNQLHQQATPQMYRENPASKRLENTHLTPAAMKNVQEVHSHSNKADIVQRFGAQLYSNRDPKGADVVSRDAHMAMGRAPRSGLRAMLFGAGAQPLRSGLRGLLFGSGAQPLRRNHLHEYKIENHSFSTKMAIPARSRIPLVSQLAGTKVHSAAPAASSKNIAELLERHTK